eukprot:CAMPEP_0205937672 /NCGR_PEP_ID=MMETSP1325-20131115/44780_1 /ASSEMBLY_ACC=CAM_ASM_000708 /TAXON_ID=236786 /ORGANISM="Florenciella sp., Strain RCC1007" /LENGTH=77 /DNA_ID=CAMNT_0053307963 /DNA_START=91 /DNA_END=321 /DNA_ORIENTATION=-
MPPALGPTRVSLSEPDPPLPSPALCSSYSSAIIAAFAAFCSASAASRAACNAPISSVGRLDSSHLTATIHSTKNTNS